MTHLRNLTQQRRPIALCPLHHSVPKGKVDRLHEPNSSGRRLSPAMTCSMQWMPDTAGQVMQPRLKLHSTQIQVMAPTQNTQACKRDVAASCKCVCFTQKHTKAQERFARGHHLACSCMQQRTLTSGCFTGMTVALYERSAPVCIPHASSCSGAQIGLSVSQPDPLLCTTRIAVHTPVP